MTGQELERKSPVQEVCETIVRPEFQAQIRAALPENVTLERFTRVALISIQQNPEIVDCDRATLFRAVVRCAQDGLLPDGREAAFVKFKQRGAKDAVQYLPMIGGYRKKAAEVGISLEARAVFANDEFEYELGTKPWVKHRPPQDLRVERGDLTGAYAVATLQDGTMILEVMTLPEIEKVRSVSRAKDSEYGPWKQWTAEMFRKTAARRLWKQLPLAQVPERTQSMIEADDALIDLAAAPVAELAALPAVDAPAVEAE